MFECIGPLIFFFSSLVDNSIRMILPSEMANPPPTGLSQILSLIRRSDRVASKSEGTRIIVNLVKSLWSNDAPNASRSAEESLSRQQKRDKAITTLLSVPCVEALTALLGRSFKYPILVNEAVVALSLLSTHCDGGEHRSISPYFDWNNLYGRTSRSALPYRTVTHRGNASRSRLSGRVECQ